MNSEIKISRSLKILFDKKAPVDVILAGCGGTGGFLAWDLARIAYHMKETERPVNLTFVDPDIVEEKNIGRQNFCPAEVGRFKAVVLAERFNQAYGLCIGNSCTQIFNHEFNIFGGITVVVGAVDSPGARAQIEGQVKKLKKHSNVWWVDCGNEYQNGQVLVGNTRMMDSMRFLQEEKLGLCSQLPLPSVQAPELVDLKHKTKERALPCAEAAAREEQSLMVNRGMATFASQILYKIIVRRELDIMAVYLGLDSCAARPVTVTRQNLERYIKNEKRRGA
jgi:PRTRC genetic system ThiF family protein